MSEEWVKVAALADLEAGAMMVVGVRDEPVCLYNLGGTVYPTFGFIYNAPAQNAPHTTTVAQASDAAVAMAQTAAGQVVNAVRPGATPLQILNQAADSTDRIAALIQAAAGGDAPADGKH